MLYLAVLRNRLRCPTTLVVFTDSLAVARWASRPIDIGCGMVMRPVVIGPEQIPSDLTRELARKVPALAALAVVAHGRGPHARRLGRLAFEVMRPLLQRGDERAILYMDVIYAYLDRAVLGEILEDSMNLAYQPISPYLKQLVGKHRTEGRQEGLLEGRQEGRQECMVQLLERLLDQRSLEPSAEQRLRLTTCDDEALLQRWFDRAITATSAAEIFES